MSEISAKTVKELRDRTGVGFMECKRALEAAGGDMEKAVEELRKRGLAKASKRAGRETNEGIVYSYIHADGRIGVMLELNCETDFVARTDEFKKLAHELALQICATNPRWIAREDVPEEVIAEEKEILRVQAEKEGKPPHIVERIVEGRLKKFFEENCLLKQPYVKNPSVTVEDVLGELRHKISEDIVIRRFARFEVGEK